MMQLNTQDYRDAMGGDGPQAGQWADKPHRLIYDLCSEIERLRNIVEQFPLKRPIVMCPHCDGRGFTVPTLSEPRPVCLECQGTGRVWGAKIEDCHLVTMLQSIGGPTAAAAAARILALETEVKRLRRRLIAAEEALGDEYGGCGGETTERYYKAYSYPEDPAEAKAQREGERKAAKGGE